jgi:hypothetical protein
MDVIEANLDFKKMLDGYAALEETEGLPDRSAYWANKFMRDFYFRMDCNGGMLESYVHASDEPNAVIEAKEKMATSFFQDTAYEDVEDDLDETEAHFDAADATESASQRTQASSAQAAETEQDLDSLVQAHFEKMVHRHTEMDSPHDLYASVEAKQKVFKADEEGQDLDETEQHFQDMAAAFFDVAHATESAHVDDMDVEDHEGHLDAEEEDSSKGYLDVEEEDSPLEARSADVTVPEAKQPKLPEGSKRKSSSLGTKECAAPLIGIKVNQTCSVSRITQGKSAHPANVPIKVNQTWSKVIAQPRF